MDGKEQHDHRASISGNLGLSRPFEGLNGLDMQGFCVFGDLALKGFLEFGFSFPLGGCSTLCASFDR